MAEWLKRRFAKSLSQKDHGFESHSLRDRAYAAKQRNETW